MKKDILDRIMWKETLVLLISLLSISYNSFAQCGCSVANTFNVTAGTTAIGTHTLGDNGARAKTSDDLCIVASGGGSVIVTGDVYMNGGDLYLCSSDGTEIDFRPTLSGQWNTSSGTVHQHTDIVFNSARDIEGFTWNIEEGTLDAFNIIVKQDANDNTRGELTVKSSGVLDAAIVNSSGQASFINYGAATITGSTSSGNVSASLENYGTLTVNGDLTRTYGTTINYGEVIVTGTLKLGGGNDSNMDLTGGVFRSDALTMSSGTYYADIGDCAVFYTNNVVGINCGSSYPNANINVIDETLDTGDSPCNTEKNDGSHFTYTDFDSAPACAQVLPVHFVDVYLVEDQLYWTTIQEENNEKFVIESSVDGKIFVEIGEVKGAVNSNYDIQYVFEDIDQTSAKTYYRIKQIDIDGDFTYSKIVTSIEDSNPIITLYPNPVSEDELNISIANIEGNVSYEIISSIGDVVFSNEIEIEDHFFEETIDVLDYTSGLYFVKVQTAQETIIEQLVIE